MEQLAMEGAKSEVENELSKLTSLSEAQLSGMTDSTLTDQLLLEENNLLKAMEIEGQEHVFRGHEFTIGLTVPRNDNEAFRHYKLGAEAGNTEGMFFYALCYANGIGVEKDYAMAYQIHLEAAAQSPDLPGRKNLANKNYGVAQAQNAIGYMHENGIGLKQNYVQASIWYKKAVNNGSGDAANNLGNFYFKGLGVPQNKRMAADLWLLAVQSNVPESANAMMLYYLTGLEPELARVMFKLGKKSSNSKFSIRKTDEQFEQLYSSVKSKRDSLQNLICEFEKEHNLTTDGMTFLDRLERETNAKTPKLATLLEKMNGRVSAKDFKISFNTKSEVDLNLLKSKAMAGSTIALEVLETLVIGDELVRLLEQDSLTESDKMRSVELFYECSIREVNTFQFPRKAMKKLEKIVVQLFQQIKRADEGDTFMKIRFCYVTLNFQPGKHVFKGIELVLEGVKRYPLNCEYYDLLSNLYGRVGDHISGLHYMDQALKNFPDNANILFSRAVHLHFQPVVDIKMAIEAYRHFILKAPEHHRKIPDAYYAMATLSKSVVEIEHYFRMGVEAEEKVLPCYLPYKSSKCKEIANTELELCAIDKAAGGLAINEKGERKETLFDRKPYLNNPVRKGLVTRHRQAIHDDKMETMSEGVNVSIQFGPSLLPKLSQKVSKRGRRPRNITLAEMKTNDDKIYKDRVIHLVIIEDPYLNSHSIELIAEDGNGDVTRLLIYNVDKTKEQIEKLGFGCKISIFNPYISVEAGEGWMRNDDPKCISFGGKKEKMCRFCGEENACSTCSKCKRADYCSKDCQTFDAKKMKHKLICFPE